MDIGSASYLPMIAKYSDYKTYCPNQDTFKSEGSIINDTAGQEA